MPYSSPGDAPSHVPEGKKAQWVKVWNAVFEKYHNEGRAFRTANGVVKREMGGEIELSDLRMDAEEARYEELPGAVKDSDCQIVFVADGVSANGGCCAEWERV